MDEFVLTLIRFTAYVAPFFLIPLTFKFGLGVFGNLAGIINDRSRGLFDRQKKARAERNARGWNAFKTGTGEGRVRQTSGFRRVGTGVGAGLKGRYGFGERGAQARSQIAGLAAQEQIMKDPRWSQINENDDALHAATYSSQSAARKALSERFRGQISSKDIDKRVAAAKANGQALSSAEARAQLEAEADNRATSAAAAAATSIGFGRSQAIAAAQQLATTGTGYTDIADQAETIARASGGDKSTAAAIAGYNNFISKQKGRHDLAPGAGALIGISQAAMSQSSHDTKVQAEAITEDAWKSGSLYTIANGKSAATKNFTAHWERQLKEGYATGDTIKMQKARTALHEMKAMIPNASGENANILNESIARMELATKDYLEVTPSTSGTGGPSSSRTTLDFQQIDQAAQTQARTYQRPDEHTLGGS